MTSTAMNGGVIFGVAIAIFGIVLVVVSIRKAVAQRRERRTWVRDRAMAVQYQWGGSRKNRVQHWILERTDSRTGEVHRTRTETGVSWGTMKQFPFEVDVIVNPQDESQFALASGARAMSGYVVFAMVGVLMVVAGLFIAGIGISMAQYNQLTGL